MTTPYEFGAGFDDGNNFVTDQGAIGFWELQWRGNDPASQVITAAASYPFYPIVWDTMVSAAPKTIYMANGNTNFIFPKSAAYNISVQINAQSASTTPAGIILDLEILKPNGASIFINGTNANTTTDFVGAKMTFSTVYNASAGDKIRAVLYCQGEDVNLIAYGAGTLPSSTQRHTFMQITEIIDPAPALRTLAL